MHCLYFICERKFLRTYARKNYATVEINPITNYFSLCSVSFVLFRGIYYVTPHYYSQSKKLSSALSVTGECGAETIADDNNNYSVYIFSANIPLNMFNIPVKQHESSSLTVVIEQCPSN